MHALRHFFASVLLDAGESIKAVSEYLGHTRMPGFTLRTYTHLMPASDAQDPRRRWMPRSAVTRELHPGSPDALLCRSGA